MGNRSMAETHTATSIIRPPMASHRDDYEHGISPERRAEERADAERRMHHDALYTLARAAEQRDTDTGAHVVRIRFVVERIAVALGIDDAEDLGYDAMVHDVGKLSVPEAILKKPGALTEEERGVMEAHTIFGERLLAPRPTMVRAARIARSHHECWDGSGYPDGLRADAIPLEARVTAAADVLDALVADRCYKEAWPYEQALGEIRRLAGTQLDPGVVSAVEKVEAALAAIFRALRP